MYCTLLKCVIPPQCQSLACIKEEGDGRSLCCYKLTLSCKIPSHSLSFSVSASLSICLSLFVSLSLYVCLCLSLSLYVSVSLSYLLSRLLNNNLLDFYDCVLNSLSGRSRRKT